MSTKPDYGIDAPGVQRNLFLTALIGLGYWGTVALGLWSGNIPIPGTDVVVNFDKAGLMGGLGCLASGVWMLWESKIGKLRTRERLLDLISWSGQESVLDLGCGRGLLLVGAARRLTGGRAIGVDLWQSEDLSGNRPDATMENARREGVAERVSLATGDMRSLPFANAEFDCVVSRAAIHNVYKTVERDQAIAEVIRVLKPGGQAIIEDIRHGAAYRAVFESHGCRVETLGSTVSNFMATLLSFGTLRPVTLRATKPV